MSGNKAGRPKSSISIDTRVRNILEGKTKLPAAIVATICKAVGADRSALDAKIIAGLLQALRHADELIEAGRGVYSELKNIVVWVKSNPGMGSLYRSQHALIFVFKSGTGRHTNNIELGKHGRNRSNVWQYDGANTQGRKGNNLLELHPTAKPVQLVMDALLDCSHRGETVLDSFLGSGTTLLAAERTGRICRGIELDPLYVDTAIRRWQNLTGRDAVRSSDSRLFREIEAERERADER